MMLASSPAPATNPRDTMRPAIVHRLPPRRRTASAIAGQLRREDCRDARPGGAVPVRIRRGDRPAIHRLVPRAEKLVADPGALATDDPVVPRLDGLRPLRGLARDQHALAER